VLSIYKYHNLFIGVIDIAPCDRLLSTATPVYFYYYVYCQVLGLATMAIGIWAKVRKFVLKLFSVNLVRTLIAIH
jgi:hypothetical protein